MEDSPKGVRRRLRRTQSKIVGGGRRPLRAFFIFISPLVFLSFDPPNQRLGSVFATQKQGETEAKAKKRLRLLLTPLGEFSIFFPNQRLGIGEKKMESLPLPNLFRLSIFVPNQRLGGRTPTQSPIVAGKKPPPFLTPLGESSPPIFDWGLFCFAKKRQSLLLTPLGEFSSPIKDWGQKWREGGARRAKQKRGVFAKRGRQSLFFFWENR